MPCPCTASAMGWRRGTSVQAPSRRSPASCSSRPAFSHSARFWRSSPSPWRFSTASAGSVAEGGDLFSACEVVGRRDLDVARFAFDHEDIAAGPFDDRGGVGADEPLAGGAVVRLEEPGRLEDLGGLYRPQVLWVVRDPTIRDPNRAPRDPKARN